MTGPCPSIYNTFSCLSGGLMTPMALMKWMSFFSPYSCYHLCCVFLIKLAHRYIWQPLFHLNWNTSKSKIYTMLIFYLHISVWHFHRGGNDVSVQWYTQSHWARKRVIYYFRQLIKHYIQINTNQPHIYNLLFKTIQSIVQNRLQELIHVIFFRLGAHHLKRKKTSVLLSWFGTHRCWVMLCVS